MVYQIQPQINPKQMEDKNGEVKRCIHFLNFSFTFKKNMGKAIDKIDSAFGNRYAATRQQNRNENKIIFLNWNPQIHIHIPHVCRTQRTVLIDRNRIKRQF